MPNFQGVWDLRTQFQYAGEWPSPPDIAVFGMGTTSATNDSATIDTVNFGSGGNATDWGDIGVGAREPAGSGSSTRGLFSGGNPSGSGHNVIQYVTIASAGTTADFGDLTVARGGAAGASSSTRSLTACGNTGSGNSDVIDYVTIASTGNAQDFGDASAAKNYVSGLASATRAVIGLSLIHI